LAVGTPVTVACGEMVDAELGTLATPIQQAGA
jgi:hypothetical protein